MQAVLSVLLSLWMNDLTNVLGLLAQSRAPSVPVTVVLILLSPALPVAIDLHANANASSVCLSRSGEEAEITGPAFDSLVKELFQE